MNGKDNASDFFKKAPKVLEGVGSSKGKRNTRSGLNQLNQKPTTHPT
jgi:hypothetical protein